jgi:hypothetical protein
MMTVIAGTWYLPLNMGADRMWKQTRFSYTFLWFVNENNLQNKKLFCNFSKEAITTPCIKSSQISVKYYFVRFVLWIILFLPCNMCRAAHTKPHVCQSMRSGAKRTVHKRNNLTSSLAQCLHTLTTVSKLAHCLSLSSLQRWQTNRRLWNYLVWWGSWLRHFTTSRNVAGSIPDGITGILHRHLWTEISTSNTSWGGRVKAAGAYGWQPNHLHVSTVWNLGASTSW